MKQSGLNYIAINEEIEQLALSCGRRRNDIQLVAISKTYSKEDVLDVYEAGCRIFGENRVQEALEKIPLCPSDIEWHLIGTLQRNKVNKAVQSFQLIESVDSLILAKKISDSSRNLDVITPILLQVNTSNEISKHGLKPEEWLENLDELQTLRNIKLKGLMTIAPFVKDQILIRSCFIELRKLKEEIQATISKGVEFDQLSMGMSHDYKIAIEEGATILRIGTAIFGQRSLKSNC
jgi:PLP dependent protein